MRKLIFIIFLFFSTSVAAFNLFGLFSSEKELYCQCETKYVKVLSDTGAKEKETKCSNIFDLTLNEKNKTIESNFLYRLFYNPKSHHIVEASPKSARPLCTPERTNNPSTRFEGLVFVDSLVCFSNPKMTQKC